MSKNIIKRINKFMEKNAQSGDLRVIEMDEIAKLGNLFDIITISFYYGYMKGAKAKKGGAV